MIRWIENISLKDIQNGWHSDMGDNAVLIQIVDPATFFPKPKKSFAEVHQFEFLDIEADGKTNNGDGTWTDMSEFAITDEQAQQLVEILKSAYERNRNVLVHCHAGICRSGAVVEVGSMMGFSPTDRYRQPNLLVKHKMMKALGWTYDSEEEYYSTGTMISSGGILVPY